MKADKIYLVGFMAAGKTTVARALARRLDWRAVDIDELIEARERMTVADIFARQGEPYFRAAERAVLARAARARGTSSSRPAAARSSIRRTAPRSTATACRSGSTCRSIALIARLPADGRRPLAADRAEFERLYHLRRAAYEQAHVRLDAGRAERRRARRAAGRLARSVGEYDPDALPRPHRHPRELEALDACLADAAARGYDRDARARRPGRLRRRSERRWSNASRRSSRSRSSAAITTRSPAASSRPEGFNAVAKSAARWTLDALTPAHRDVARRAAGGADRSSTTSSRSATARRSTRTPTSSTSSTPCAR